VYCAGCGHALGPVPPLGWRRLLPLLIIAGGLAAYANSFDKAFVFDDEKQIVNNERLRDLSNLSRVIGGRRPVTDLTLAVNYHFHELDVSGYHVVNLTVHILAALTLYGIVRRTLMLESMRGRFGRASPWIALSVALIWVVHPLQTQSVTYLIQRAESLMGLFYLLTIYCVVRGATSDRRWVWSVAAAVACGLGMGSKAVMVTAPIAVLLYDRVYLSGSLGELFKRRWPLYVMLCATWGVLGTTRVLPQVMSSSKPNATVGFSVKQITPVQYLVTQPDVLRKYLKLSFWPATLCLDYSWDAPIDGETGEIDWSRVALPGTVIVALLGITVWLLITRPKLGFVCAWFFLILAPTSSIVPIKDVIFEHRMYLSLASVVTLTVVVAYLLLRELTARRPSGSNVRMAVGTSLCAVVVVCVGCQDVQPEQGLRKQVCNVVRRDIEASGQSACVSGHRGRVVQPGDRSTTQRQLRTGGSLGGGIPNGGYPGPGLRRSMVQPGQLAVREESILGVGRGVRAQPGVRVDIIIAPLQLRERAEEDGAFGRRHRALQPRTEAGSLAQEGPCQHGERLSGAGPTRRSNRALLPGAGDRSEPPDGSFQPWRSVEPAGAV